MMHVVKQSDYIRSCALLFDNVHLAILITLSIKGKW